MKITILYYGSFRAFGKQSDLMIGSPVTIEGVKSALATHLGNEQRILIQDSVFANETDILTDNTVLEQDCILSILPPVCGG